MAKRLVILMILIGGAGVAYVNRHRIKALFSEDNRTINKTEKRLLFREDPSLVELTGQLIDQGIIPDAHAFNAYVKENNIDTANFAAGKYIILSRTQLGDLVQGFVKGENGQGKAEKKVNVLFNRCEVIEDIGANISHCILADSASIVDHIYDSRTLRKYGFTPEQVPALFIPGEYEMYFDTDAGEFVAFMAKEFKAFWNEDRRARLASVGLTAPSQAVTIASIVYMEQSRVPEEWPIIAKLYLNRIARGIPLEADPTFKFCWPDRLKGVEHLLNVHKQKDCPYNTYIYRGLPPGPICLPPGEVVDAVLNPADVDYLFLCGDGTGKHNFATTNAEHNRNVENYRVWLREYMKNRDN